MERSIIHSDLFGMTSVCPGFNPSVTDFSIELDEHALIETLGATRYVYGRWSVLFGCWRRTGDNTITSFVPRWPVLNGDGRFIGCDRRYLTEHLDDEFFTTYWESEQSEEENYRRANFFEADFDCSCAGPDTRDWEIFVEEIPITIRLLAARFQLDQWLALEAMSVQPQLIQDFEYQETRSYFSSVMLLAQVQAMTRQNRVALYHRLSKHPRRSVLAAITGRPVAKSDVNLLQRCAPDLISHKDLSVILEANQALGPNNTLSKTKLVGWNTAVAVERLPPWLLNCSVLEAAIPILAHDRESLEEDCAILQTLLDRVTRLGKFANAKLLLHRSLKTSVKGSRSVSEQLQIWIAILLRQIDVDVPSKVRYHDPLVPLRSYREFRLEARDMRNCLHQRYANAVVGDSSFFAWLGASRASVEIQHNQRGWAIAEIKGFDNTEIPVPEQLLIVEAFDNSVSVVHDFFVEHSEDCV